MLNKKGEVDIVWKDMKSHTIKSIYYRSDGVKSMLGVTFKSGESYVYDKVPLNEIIGMLKAESAGTFFSKSIRMSYSYKKVQTEEGVSPLEKIGFVL